MANYMSVCSATATSGLAGAAEAVPITSFSANREKIPMVVPVCSPSAAAPQPRPLPVRAEFHAPLCVKAALRSGAPAGPGLDTEWYTQQARTGGSVFEMVIEDISSM